MANATAIEWTDLSWNPVHGCSIVSTECRNCYAMTLSLRYGLTSRPWTPANAAENVTLKPHKLLEPLSARKEWRGLGAAAAAAGKTDGKLVFVNSMSDLFHDQVPDEFIAAVFATMALAHRHTFQVLTKRPERMQALLSSLRFAGLVNERLVELHADELDVYDDWPLPNVWLGVSVGNRQFVDRADMLRGTPAMVRFISAEPLLGPLIPDGENDGIDFRWADDRIMPGLSLYCIDWLIVGGESGSGHRPTAPEWVRALRDRCIAGRPEIPTAVEVQHQPLLASSRRVGLLQLERQPAFFFKQWGGARPGGEALLDGRMWREFPAVACA